MSNRRLEREIWKERMTSEGGDEGGKEGRKVKGQGKKE